MAIFIQRENRDQETALVNQLNAEIDALLQDPNLDPTIKQQVLADIALTQDTIQKDQMLKSDARQYTLGVLNGIKQKLAGEQGYSPTMVGSAVQNWRGKYSPDEIRWMVNETLKRSAQPEQSAVFTPVYAIPEELGRVVHVFNPASDTSKIYQIADGTPNKSDSIKAFSTYLLGQLQDIPALLNDSNASLHGWETSNNKYINDWIQALSSYGSGTDDTLNSQILSLGNMINLLKNSNLQNMFEDTFQYWLKGFAPEEKDGSVGKAPVKTVKINGIDTPLVEHDNAHAASLIKNKGWQVVKEGDNYVAYLVGGDGEVRPVKNEQIIVIDPTDRATWKKAVLTDANGVISYGDLGSDEFVRTLSPTRWAELQEYIKKEHEAHFGKAIDGSDKGLGRYIDLSNFFTGSDPIIYQLGADAATDPLWYDWDAIGNIDNFVFAGNTDATASGGSVSNQYAEEKGDPGDISTISAFSEEMASERFGGTSNNTGDINLRGRWVDPTFREELVYSPGHLSDSIINFMYHQIKLATILASPEADKEAKLQEVQNKLIEICPNYEEIVTPKGSRQEKQLGDVIKDTIQSDQQIYKSILKSILMNPNMQDVRGEVVALLQKFISAHKNGGILKAFEGATLATDVVDKEQRAEDAGGAMNIQRQDLDESLDAEQIEGMRWLLGSAITDFIDVVTPNSNRKVGRVISPILNSGSLTADIIAANKLDMTNRQKAWLFGADALGLALSTMPLLDKIDKVQRMQVAQAVKKMHIAAGITGMGFSGVSMFFNTPDALAAAKKLWDGRYHEMTAADLHALTTWATSLASGIKGTGNIAYGVRSNPVKPDPEYIYIDTKGPDGRKAKRVRKADYDAAMEQAKEEAGKGFFGKRKRKNEALQQLLGDSNNGVVVKTNILGNPRTKPALKYDEAQKAKTTSYQLQRSSLLKPSIIKKPGTFSLEDNPYFGLKMFDFDWHPFKSLSGVDAVSAKRVTKDNVVYDVMEVAWTDYEDAIKQFFKQTKKQKPTDITDIANHDILKHSNLPSGTKAKQMGNLIIYAKPSPTMTVNKSGGKLQRLNMYLNK